MSGKAHEQSFLIIGYGREGKSAHRFLRQRLPAARIGIADRDPSACPPCGDRNTAVFSGNNYLAQANTFSTVVRSPGVSIRQIAPYVAPNANITSATEIFFSECPGTIIGVTGTKGKSTTSSLTAAILKEALPDVRLVGNIGTPALNQLEGATRGTYFVMELSSYQLENLTISPHIAILLNIVPEHLDYHGGFEQYRGAKLNIARYQNSSDFLIYNDSFESLFAVVDGFKGQRCIFRHDESKSAAVSVVNEKIVLNSAVGPTTLLAVQELPVRGPGNLQNVLAAVTCALTLGIDLPTIRRAITAFEPLEHRLEFVAERSGITFYNDSLSTIPEALRHALEALGDRVETVIAGGYDRGVDMTSVGPTIANSCVRTLILFPTTGEKIWEATVAAAPSRNIRRIDVQTMNDAVQAAYDHTAPGKICVLSPAASSFSVFRDYRERGEQFKDAVRRLEARGNSSHSA